jgi:hypothetical protein
VLKELSAFAQMADLDIRELAGLVADGFDWCFFGIFLWRAKDSFKVSYENALAVDLRIVLLGR